MIIEANGYRFNTKIGKLTKLYDEKYYGFSLDVTQIDAETLIAAAITATRAEPATDDTSDGFHTFRELYEYRMVYNALLFNEWAKAGVNDVHKSRKHSDGEPCFGGGWFIVVAELPNGQASNHYRDEHWDLFDIPERELPNTYDGHTPQIALERMREHKPTATRAEPIEVRYRWDDDDQKYLYSLITLGRRWGDVYGQNPAHVDFFQKFSTPPEFDTEPEAREWLIDQTKVHLSAQLGREVVMVEEA